MITGSVARRYARALFELAVEGDISGQVEADLRDFVQTLEDQPELGSALLNPAISTGVRRNVVDSLLPRSGYQQITRNFLRLLVDKNRIDHLAAIVREYRGLSDEQQGRVRAEVRSAVALPDADLKRLTDQLGRITGKQVLMSHRVEPGLIGGMVTAVGGLVFDGSLRTQLDHLRDRLLRDTT
ncbi:MAG: ATP synthase F1 subunit delta [Myxococcota bacterium]|nr:ATP synthase F1 subunit delta [Myxococcota bacterium]